MAEVIKQYVAQYILNKIKEVPENDLLYKEYQEAKKLLAGNLSKEIVNRIIEGEMSFDNLDHVIYDIVSEKVRNQIPYIPNNLEDLLSITVALGALRLRSKTKIWGREKTETKEDLNKEHIEYIRIAGVLVNTSVLQYRRYESVAYKASSYLLPLIKNKKELLTVLAAMPESILQLVLKGNYTRWLNNDPRLFSIVQKYSKNPCSLLEEYPEIIKPLYVLEMVINGNLRREIEYAKISRSSKVERLNEIWNKIERNVRENSKYMIANYKCKNTINLSFSWGDVFKLRKISNNIIFWYNLCERCKDKIYEYLKRECEERMNYIIEEREARRDY